MFCGRCGAALPETASFCSACGTALVKVSPPQPPPMSIAPAVSVVADEHYLGGLTSPNLHLKGRGVSSMGYGVYVTDRRIIGVNSQRGLLAAIAAVGGVTGIAFAVAGATDASTKALAELDAKKDFEVRKEDIARIEVRRPRGIHVGFLDLALASGPVVRVTIADKPEFGSIRDLMRAFAPDRLVADA